MFDCLVESRAPRCAFAVALLAFCALGCSTCGKHEDAPPPAAASQPLAADKPAAQAAPAKPAAPKEPTAAQKYGYPRPGWTAISVHDDVPLCLFTDYEAHFRAKFVEEVERQKLTANHSVVIGAFSGWCVNEACDDLPSLQCSVKREGNTLIVHSKYWGARKNGSTCKDVPCRPVTAGCETPALEPGIYTVKHGEMSFEFRIPTVLREPCFGTEPRVPPEE
jgi:hypothetical protein